MYFWQTSGKISRLANKTLILVQSDEKAEFEILNEDCLETGQNIRLV